MVFEMISNVNSYLLSLVDLSKLPFFFFKAEKHTHGVAADSESLITVLILNRHEIYRLKQP